MAQSAVIIGAEASEVSEHSVLEEFVAGVGRPLRHHEVPCPQEAHLRHANSFTCGRLKVCKLIKCNVGGGDPAVTVFRKDK